MTHFHRTLLAGGLVTLLVSSEAGAQQVTPGQGSEDAKMQFGSGGPGSGSHLTCARVNAAVGAEATHVPYRGSGQAMQDLYAGRIDYYCSLAAAATGPMQTGNVNPINALLSAWAKAEDFEAGPFLLAAPPMQQPAAAPGESSEQPTEQAA